jgi:hypothetical protein
MKNNQSISKKQKEDKIMNGYKEFDKDFKCNGLQYEVGKEVKEETGQIFYEEPIDALKHYAIERDGRHAIVMEIIW